MGDAIVRTLVRLFVTRRHLLEWTTAAQSTGSPRLDLRGFYRQMAGGTALGLAVAIARVSPSRRRPGRSSLPFALALAGGAGARAVGQPVARGARQTRAVATGRSASCA